MAWTEQRADGKTHFTRKAGLVFLLAVLVVVGIIVSSSHHAKENQGVINALNAGSSGTSGDTGTTGNSAAIIDTTTTTSAPRLVTIQTQSGSGISSLPEFTIPEDATAWYFGWNYDCSSFGSQGNFAVDVDGLDGTSTFDLGTNQLGTSGNNVENYYDTGTFQLSVNSECNWAVKVTATEP